MNQRFTEAPRPTFIEEDDLFESDNWRERAKCRGTAPEEIDRLFFSDDLKSDLGRRAVSDAKVICGACPVASECLYFAMRTNEKHGVWGGMTTEERKSMKEEIPGYGVEAA